MDSPFNVEKTKLNLEHKIELKMRDSHEIIGTFNLNFELYIKVGSNLSHKKIYVDLMKQNKFYSKLHEHRKK